MTITNRKELLQAAQKAASDSLEKPLTHLELHKFKAEAFDGLGLGDNHFQEFSQQFDAARNSYESLAQLPVK